MKILVRIYISIILLLISVTIKADHCNTQLSKNDIYQLKQAMIKNKDILKDDEVFLDIKKMEVTNKQLLNHNIKSHGSSYLFYNEEMYVLFIKYLDEISNSFCAFKNKPIKFQAKEYEYVYYFLEENNKVTIIINVITRKRIEGFGNPEISYMYTFEKNNQQKVVLSKINAAG